MRYFEHNKPGAYRAELAELGFTGPQPWVNPGAELWVLELPHVCCVAELTGPGEPGEPCWLELGVWSNRTEFIAECEPAERFTGESEPAAALAELGCPLLRRLGERRLAQLAPRLLTATLPAELL